ncbi:MULTISPECIES: HEAT repeat domain-containing protein [Bacillus]|uniref:HEAT repeat domain-containing protein n=1 Tax=Bacillus TaxID=1386 RepID=UPI0011A8136E|nr:HEAT repeat domain-containing protein [Bacillus safensis]MDI0275102.1 HEAT repeat domain-containing protein [Bacillus safensis]UXO88339.1 HEAT repeat domain-containing protein [Bacillus safensis]
MKPENKLSQSVQQLANTNEVTIVQAIGDLRKYGKDAVPVLVEALKEKGSLRNIAAAVLGEFGADAGDAAEPLARLLESDEEDTRMAAAMSLMRIGQPSLPFLLALAKHYEGPTCFWASWCISWIDPSKIEKNMYECLKQEQENPTGSVTPFAAEEALGKIIAFQLKEKGDE